MFTFDIINILIEKEDKFLLFINNIYILLSKWNGFFKGCIFLYNRNAILSIISICMNKVWIEPRNEKEEHLIRNWRFFSK